jgi:hypothetical protein
VDDVPAVIQLILVNGSNGNRLVVHTILYCSVLWTGVRLLLLLAMSVRAVYEMTTTPVAPRVCGALSSGLGRSGVPVRQPVKFASWAQQR